MRSPFPRPFSRFHAAVLLVPAIALVIHACGGDHSQPTAPILLGARSSASKVLLTVNASGSTAGGTITSSRGGISCTFTVSGGVLSKSGKCAQEYKTGTSLTLTATPTGTGVTASWTEGCTGVAEGVSSCQVTMDVPRTVNAVFAQPATSFPLKISGGAGGSGKVTSSPAGISCTITSGAAAATGCTANFGTGASVTLTATAAAGSYLKAWAGAGCDATGTGKGGGAGSCAVKMSAAQNVIVSFDPTSPIAGAGEWSAPITWPVLAIHAALLPNGHVLTWGQRNGQPAIWTPPATVGSSGTFVSTTEPADLFCSGHTFLPDGRVLVAGGHSGTVGLGIRNSAIFDFATNSFTSGPLMANGRWYPTNTALASGEVVTMSGGDTAQQENLIPEVYQANGTWRELSTASLYLPYYPMAFVAPAGNVFVAGPSQTTYFLDPTGTGHWTAGPSSLFGVRDYGSAVMYDVGKIFMVGGGAPTATAEVIDINAGSGAWRSVASMAVPRRQSNATILADGKVLVTGGTNATGFNNPPSSTAVLAAELWDPATEQWKTLARMSHYRLYHSAALMLQDGRVLSVGSGGPAATGLTDDLTAEIFTPPYLFNADGTLATRPTITAAPSSVTYNQGFTVQMSAPTSVSKVTWISLGSVTHSYNENQRVMRLNFTASGTSAIAVTAPARAALAPPGYYLLFILDSRGVPSVAKIVRIG
ncbi:MAG: Galactose oxidase precursor [Gemmatimonadetes bacterium]|nr:Galactose oxidase precursor [Gemmatimonadota bacterium]